jgi:hypothetical protein
MTKLFLIAVFAFFGQTANVQSNKGLCKVEVNDVSKTTSFGYLVGYSVTFKNNSKKTVDGVYWNVYFYNNNGDLIKEDKSTFNSTSLIDPIASGFTKILVRSPRVKGASKVIVKITKVHFSDGTTCN